MSEEQAFLNAIEDDPRDWDTRKIYSDWLEDQDRLQEADFQRQWNDERQDAKEYIENLSDNWSYDEIMETLDRVYDAGEPTREDWERGFGLSQDIYPGTKEFDDLWKAWSLVRFKEVTDDVKERDLFICPCA